MDKDTEREIAKGLQEGDRSAWLQLYEAYAESVWQNIARFMGYGCPAVADVVQETFLAAARSAKNFDPRRGSLWIWLWGIGRRQIALYYRKQDPKIILIRVKKWWASLDGEKIDWINAREDTPPEVLEAHELAVLVRFALIKLPDEYQTLLLAKYVDGQSVNKIAEDLDCSPVAVTSKLARARKTFRRAFSRLIQSTPDSKEVSLR
ncbi:MAG TPA: sigma-70 family RNA polymerase sigma factor [Sedimentisphaerales bacterium]|nr:sigma-70 family RNA polymerase sigma factor [Sedimentisphaerales bacterium]